MNAIHFFKRNRIEIFILLLALVVRLFYFDLRLEVNNGDLVNTVAASDGYFTVSQNLIEGHGLSGDSTPPYTPYSFRPPLFHFFVAGAYELFGGYWGVISFQILLASLLPLIGMRLVRFFIEDEKIITALGIFLALEPSFVLYSVLLYSEILFIFLLFTSVWTFFLYAKDNRSIHLVLSAFLLGLATLTRPTTEYLPVVIIGMIIWNQRKKISYRKILTNLGIYAGIFLLTIAPWVYRNYVVFGVAGISPQTGVNLYTIVVPTVYSIERGTTFQQEFATLKAAGVHGPNEADITEGDKDMAIAVPILLSHPKGLILSIMNDGWSFFVLDGTFDFLRQIKIRPQEMIGKPSLVAVFSNPAATGAYIVRNLSNGPFFAILLGRVLWITLTFLCFFGVWRYKRTHGMSPYAMTALLVILYFAATALLTGFGLVARYRLPVNVFIVAFALYEIRAIAPWWLRVAKRFYV